MIGTPLISDMIRNTVTKQEGSVFFWKCGGEGAEKLTSYLQTLLIKIRNIKQNGNFPNFQTRKSYCVGDMDWDTTKFYSCITK